MIIAVMGSGGHEAWTKALIEACELTGTTIDIVIIEPTRIESQDFDFHIKNYDQVMYELEQELDIPFRDRFYNMPVKIPPAPQRKRVFKPSTGRS
jgi:hypothetical protein